MHKGYHRHPSNDEKTKVKVSDRIAGAVLLCVKRGEKKRRKQIVRLIVPGRRSGNNIDDDNDWKGIGSVLRVTLTFKLLQVVARGYRSKGGWEGSREMEKRFSYTLATGSNPFVFAFVDFCGQHGMCPDPDIHGRCLRRVHTTFYTVCACLPAHHHRHMVDTFVWDLWVGQWRRRFRSWFT